VSLNLLMKAFIVKCHASVLILEFLLS
jgi:hypothetical protein